MHLFPPSVGDTFVHGRQPRRAYRLEKSSVFYEDAFPFKTPDVDADEGKGRDAAAADVDAVDVDDSADDDDDEDDDGAGGDHHSPELRRSRRLRFQPDRSAEVDFDETMGLARRRDGDSGGRGGACNEPAEEDEAPPSSGGEDVDVFYDVPDDGDEGLASPQSEHEALNGPDRHRWMEAERDEYQSAMDGQVADLVPPPDNEPVLPSKMVYKTTRDEMTATSCATRQGSVLSCGPLEAGRH